MQEENVSKQVQNTSSQTETGVDSSKPKQTPTFQLRLDDLNDYREGSWIETPVLSPDAKVDLSPKQCEETFKFFLLSGERLTQMTRTYHDVDAVMHLLEEKEKDLELAARIGQTLLNRNQQVNNENDLLQEKLANALEETNQLKHEISKKEQLLNIYTEAEMDEDGDDIVSLNSLQSHVDKLHNQIQKLEQDKKELLKEKSTRENQCVENNEDENILVSTTVKQLSLLQKDLQSANTQILAVTDELTKRSGDASKQYDEISVLLQQIKELQLKHGQLISDHEDLQHQLKDANKSQIELSQEVYSLETKYQEVLDMLDDTREEMRNFHGTSLSSESSDFQNSSWQIPYSNSLAAELKAENASLENSENRKSTNELKNSYLFYDDYSSSNSTFSNANDMSKIQNGILKTAKYVNKQKISATSTPKFFMSTSLPLSLQKLPVSHKPKFKLGTSTPLLESPDLGQPGVPGTADLQRAIQKLNKVGKEGLKLIQQTRHQIIQSQKPTNKAIKKCMSAPKLQIVKPLEGSSTLHQWKSLAEESKSFSSSLQIPMTATGVISRGSISNSTPSLKTKESLKLKSSFDSPLLFQTSSPILKPRASSTLTGTSGILLAANMKNNQQQTSFSDNENFPSTSRNLKSVQSSPYLPGLAAALFPSSTNPSVAHAVSCPSAASSIKSSSSLDLTQLHGCHSRNSSFFGNS